MALLLSILPILALTLFLLVFPASYAVVLTVLVGIFGDTVIAHVILFAVYISSFLCIFIRRIKKIPYRKDSEEDADMFW